MRIVHADTFTVYPLGLAGGHRVNHALLQRLAALPGVECAVVAPHSAIGAPTPEYCPRLTDFAALGIREFRQADGRWRFDCGYPIWVVDELEAELAVLLDDRRPTVLFTSSAEPEPLVRLARARGVPTVCYVQDVRFRPAAARAVLAAGGRVLVCSRFMARWLARESGVEAEVLYPPVPELEYRVERPAAGVVTFINPVPAKGLEVFLEIAAALPEERFLVVESWSLKEDFERVRTLLAAFTNVRFLPRQADVRQVYAETELLLVPSKIEESAGRVVVEAQWSGIPVLVSGRGGLPEMVGDGGLVIDDYLSAGAWVEAVRGLRRDPGALAALAGKARHNAGRPEFSPERAVARLHAICREALDGVAAGASARGGEQLPGPAGVGPGPGTRAR